MDTKEVNRRKPQVLAFFAILPMAFIMILLENHKPKHIRDKERNAK